MTNAFNLREAILFFFDLIHLRCSHILHRWCPVLLVGSSWSFPETNDWQSIAGWFTWKMNQFIQHQFDEKDHMAKPVLDVDETNEKNENSKKKRKEWRWCWCEDLNVKTLAMLTISRWFSSIFASPSGEGGFRWKPDFSSLAKCLFHVSGVSTKFPTTNSGLAATKQRHLCRRSSVETWWLAPLVKNSGNISRYRQSDCLRKHLHRF